MVLVFKLLPVLCAMLSAEASLPYGDLIASGERTLVQCKTQSVDVFDDDLQTSVSRMKDCLRSAFLASLDDLAASPEIPLNDYISLVNTNNSLDRFTSRSDPDEDLVTTVVNKMYSILNTHSFKLNLAPLDETEPEGQVEGRQRRIRRRFRRAFPMVVAGFMIMAAILIPPGFQFMAIVTSKALLIAKIAFIMAVAGHYRSVMGDLNYHHHDTLHHGGSANHLQLHPGELPGGLGLHSAILGSINPGLTQAFGVQNSPFGNTFGNSILPLRRS